MEPSQLELPFSPQYYLGIYESPLRWSGYSVPITTLSEGNECLTIRLEQDYQPLAARGMELEIHSSLFQQIIGLTLSDIVKDTTLRAVQLWSAEGQWIGHCVVGTKEKLRQRIG
ncbi:hypothetical protein J4210_01590 [Candidatus Woesearchaeota archaeon]|nr:hypothetical protein [Candidatus Woesearchaeota archaeon]